MLRVFVMGSLISTISIVCSTVIWFEGFIHKELYAMFVYAAACVAAVSLVAPVGCIRCPQCGARWLWLTLKEENRASWYRGMTSQSCCRVCGYGGGVNEKKLAQDIR